MINPAAVNLTARRNADYAETWVVAESFDALGNAVGPVNLTGYSAAMQVRLYGLAGGDPLIDLDTVTTAIEGIRFIEPLAGQFEVRIDAASIDDLPAAAKAGGTATFSYDIILTDPDGLAHAYAAGDFTVYPGVTR